jgi:hypothetical protein
LRVCPSGWATGQYIQEIRFFSYSGMDLDDNLAYFQGRLGILRPTFDDKRLFAAYRQMAASPTRRRSSFSRSAATRPA